MAKNVEGYIQLQIPAGKATPAPAVGPALGQHGVNIVECTKQFNAKTEMCIRDRHWCLHTRLRWKVWNYRHPPETGYCPQLHPHLF